MKKSDLFLMITILSVISLAVFGTWAVISFLTFLVKDWEYAWWTLWVSIGSFVLIFIASLLMNAYEVVEKKMEAKETPFKRKSAFQQRLDDTIERKNKNLKKN